MEVKTMAVNELGFNQLATILNQIQQQATGQSAPVATDTSSFVSVGQTVLKTGYDNMLNAIQQGIFTTSTKERLEALEREKSELSVQIMKEEMSRPNLTKEQILFWIHKFRKLNPKKLEHRRRLINSFLNSVYLFDDKIIIDCNYKDGTETITFEEIENSALGSDLRSLAAPKTTRFYPCRFSFSIYFSAYFLGEIAISFLNTRAK